MKLTELAQEYKEWFKYERGATRTSCLGYNNYLDTFILWLQENGYGAEPMLEHFNTATIRRYVIEIGKQGFRPRTVRGRIQPLRGLGVYLVERGMLTETPLTGVKTPKLDAPRCEQATDEEINALIAACERIPARRRALYKAVIFTLVFSGLRRQEVLDLKVSDFDPRQNLLIVRCGKGQKSRNVYLPAEATDAICSYLPKRPANARLDYLFLLSVSTRVAQDKLRFIVEEVRSAADLDDASHITPHVLRHAYATRLMRNGADLRVIQSALGHTDLRTTANYLHADEERLRGMAHLASLSGQVPVTPAPTPEVTSPAVPEPQQVANPSRRRYAVNEQARQRRLHRL